ncbi:uncharacterized protein EAF01_000138 [Botrytis porri]|uniref:uncharacterized protein n=1 Tax=Botrytis porri TaxID=87229 RepID=UPI0018FF2945|nr:uncharacterized protein EAF01_000138 [Botrytis porri]KAF7913732.1 hypothetical protein EAF01_000138 [Botrytis porri]
MSMSDKEKPRSLPSMFNHIIDFRGDAVTLTMGNLMPPRPSSSLQFFEDSILDLYNCGSETSNFSQGLSRAPPIQPIMEFPWAMIHSSNKSPVAAHFTDVPDGSIGGDIPPYLATFHPKFVYSNRTLQRNKRRISKLHDAPQAETVALALHTC